MQAVILAAGHGTRMDELTTAVPKPMLDLLGKPLLQYKLDALGDEFSDVVIIIGYEGDVIKHRFSAAYDGRKITYVEQGSNGTAGALWSAQELLKDKFLVMTGDDIFAAEDIERVAAVDAGWAVLVQQLPEMHRAGSVELDADGRISRIVEGDLGGAPGIASTNLFLLDTRIFSCPLVPKQPCSLEYGLPQTIVQASASLGVPFEPVFTERWIQINSPADLVRATELVKAGTYA